MSPGLLVVLLLLVGCAPAGSSPAPAPTPTPATEAVAPPDAAEAPTPAPAPEAGNSTHPDDRPGIAVFPFFNGGSYGPNREDLDALQVGMQQMLLTELAQNPALRIVERSLLREILEEQNLGTAGRLDARTAAQVGRLVGARYAITGSFLDSYGSFHLNGRIIDVETGEVIKAEQVQARRERMYPLLLELSAKLTTSMNLPPLPPQQQQERRSRELPAEAITLFSRAQVYQDRGHTDRAIELYRNITERFPQMTEAREALRQLTQS